MTIPASHNGILTNKLGNDYTTKIDLNKNIILRDNTYVYRTINSGNINTLNIRNDKLLCTNETCNDYLITTTPRALVGGLKLEKSMICDIYDAFKNKYLNKDNGSNLKSLIERLNTLEKTNIVNLITIVDIELGDYDIDSITNLLIIDLMKNKLNDDNISECL